MPLIQEMFDKGLVTKRHSTFLRPGELQQSDDCVYRIFDPAIHRAPGRTVFNSTALSASPIKGLAHLLFDLTTDSDLIVAYHTTKLHTAPFAAITGTFTALLDDIPALPDVGTETMVPVPFGDRYHLLIPGAFPRRIGYARPSGGDVASSTIAGNGITVTTTTAKGFKNTVVGQGVSGTGIPAGTRIASKTSDTVIVLDTASTPATITITLSSTAFLQQQVAGLLPTSEPVTATQTADAGDAWSSVLGTGFYWFIYTEMVMPGIIDDESTGFLESGFIGAMSVAQITATATQAVNITRPTSVVNTVANGTNATTHWQVYMSDVSKDAVTKPSLATFKRIGGPIAIATTSFKFKDTQATQPTGGGYAPPTANTTIAGLTALDTPSGAHTAYDGSVASNPGPVERGSAYQTFGFTNNGLTVVGVEVKIYMKGIVVIGSIRLRTSSKVSTQKSFGGLVIQNVITLGSPTDTWAESWVASDFINGTFLLDLRLKGGVIDGITVKVYYTGTDVNRNGRQFRTVTYRDQVGTIVSDTVAASLYQPTTGDVFAGSMVINDPNDPSIVRFSLPGTATMFPKPYFLRFQLPDRKDRITYIKRVGQVLLVAMRDHIQRVNYLPTELDTDFQQGLAHEDLVVDHGIPGPLAAVLVDMGNGPVLAYVSMKGLHVTDGITSRFLNIDLDWGATVDVSKLDKCILRVYTKENWIVLFYVPQGVTHSTPTRAMIFSYAPDRIKEGGLLAAVGPIKVAARSACAAILNGTAYILTGHNSLGKVYVEDQVLALPAGYTVLDSAGAEAAITIVPTIKTRRIYPSGLGRQAREQRIYMMSDAHGAIVSASSSTTLDSTTVTSAALFGSVLVGMLVRGTGVQPDTVVTAKASSSSITISRAATVTGTATLTFDDGVFSVTVRGQDIGYVVGSLETVYDTTRVGGLTVMHPDNMKESFELLIAKVTLPDSSTAAFDVGMRLHYFAYLQTDAGQETNTAP